MDITAQQAHYIHTWYKVPVRDVGDVGGVKSRQWRMLRSGSQVAQLQLVLEETLGMVCCIAEINSSSQQELLLSIWVRCCDLLWTSQQ